MRGAALTNGPRGAHVKKGDPFLSVECRALHARAAEPLATPESSASTAEPLAIPELGASPPVLSLPMGAAPDWDMLVEALTTEPARNDAPDWDMLVEALTTRPARNKKRVGRTTNRRRSGAGASGRRALVPLAGAAGAVAAGLGGGVAFAFLDAHSVGSGQTTAGGSPVTVSVAAATGNADLLPGGTGAVYFTLHDAGSSGVTFDQVAPGSSVVSDNTALCPSEDVSIAQPLPYTLPTAVTVSPGGTSATQSIANFVKLAPNAPGTCQGVTFTVTLTFSGRSS
jgi:hypothetical protein